MHERRSTMNLVGSFTVVEPKVCERCLQTIGARLDERVGDKTVCPSCAPDYKAELEGYYAWLNSQQSSEGVRS